MADPEQPSTGADRLARLVLRAPNFIRRAAARQARAPEEAWMLQQRRDVRESFVREVLDRGGDQRLAEIWMLRQGEDVRESYVREVLEPALPPDLR
jgi:hypothetical protein